MVSEQKSVFYFQCPQMYQIYSKIQYSFIYCYSYYTLSSSLMKEINHFHLHQSQQHIPPIQPEKQSLQQSLPQNQINPISDRQADSENIIKTPKSKMLHKLSNKTNPEDYSPSRTPKLKEKKSKILSTEKQKNPNQLFGHWSHIENKRYHWFLEVYHSHFMNRCLRRMDRIFTSMAKFIATRQAEQCRSHHQKMQKKYKTFSKILLNLRKIHYESNDDVALKLDMDQNQISIIEPLLSEEFLLQHAQQKQTPNSSQNLKQEQKVQSPISDEFQLEQNEEKSSQQQVQQMISQILQFEPQPESSKNDLFKFFSIDEEKSNLLDDGYQNKFSFNNFF